MAQTNDGDLVIDHGGEDRLDGDSGRVVTLTREFRATIMVDLRHDRAYRGAYLAELIECMCGGEFAVGKRMLHSYIRGTLRFRELSKAVGSPPNSLVRMLTKKSSPHAGKLFEILGYLQSRDNWTITTVPTCTRQLRAFERRVYRLERLPPEIMAAIKVSKMDASHNHLNALLDQKVHDNLNPTKTLVPVKLARYGAESLISRSQAKRLLARVDKFETVIFDFDDIDTIGQAFADEIFRVFALEHPQMRVLLVNANESVTKMIDRVAHTNAVPTPPPTR